VFRVERVCGSDQLVEILQGLPCKELLLPMIIELFDRAVTPRFGGRDEERFDALHQAES